MNDATSSGDELIGQVVAGRYRVLRKLGSGGMGAVYLATQEPLGRQVALKVIRKGQDEPKVVARFQREAKTISQLVHPNIITIFDFGAADDGSLFIAMEYIEGATLGDRIAAAPIQWPVAVHLATQIAQGLQAAHEKGIIHRDLKPDNVMLVDDLAGPQVKLLDFGVAKALNDDEDQQQQSLTGEGLVVGTPGYIAPEHVIEGMHDDPRADLYALGVIFFEMLSGKPPFAAKTPVALVLKHSQDPVPRILSVNADAQVPKPVEDLVLQLLEKKPEMRPANAAAVTDRLREIVAAQDSGIFDVKDMSHDEVTRSLRAMRTKMQFPIRTVTDEIRSQLSDSVSDEGEPVQADAQTAESRLGRLSPAAPPAAQPTPATVEGPVGTGPEQRAGQSGGDQVQSLSISDTERAFDEQELPHHAFDDPGNTLDALKVANGRSSKKALLAAMALLGVAALVIAGVVVGKKQPLCRASQVQLCREQCEQGRSAACTQLGVVEKDGFGVVQNSVAALQHFALGCKGGDASGCTHRGQMLERGVVGLPKKKAARTLYETACKQKDPAACARLSVLAAKTNKARSNHFLQRAMKLAKVDCDAGHGRSCRVIGELSLSEELGPINIEAAAKAYQQSCDLGDARACTQLGFLRNDGKPSPLVEGLMRKGCASGDQRACAYTKCQLGDPASCVRLGEHYANETTRQGAAEQAAALYRQACEKENARGCLRFGQCFSAGWGGVKRNLTVAKNLARKAAALYQRQCETKDAAACSALGTMYRKGDGVDANAQVALDAYRVACAQKDAASCYWGSLVAVRAGKTDVANLMQHQACTLGGAGSLFCDGIALSP